MKNFLRIIFIIFIGAVALSISSCKRGCANVSCRNAGKCVDGKCQCPIQYFGEKCEVHCPLGKEGVNCDVNSIDKFIGYWDCVTKNTNTGTTNNVIEIQRISGSSTRLKIYNFNNESYYMIGELENWDYFNIFSQTATGAYNGLISGSGKMQNGKLVFEIYKGTAGTIYTAECTRR